MKRQYVLLSANVATAKQVGARHDSQPALLIIHAQDA